MDTIPHRQRLYTLAGIALAMFLGALDQTIVAPAMPRITVELGGLDRYAWVTTVYLLVSTLLVPVYGRLADIMNRKTLEVWSILVFVAGSTLCGLSGLWGGDGMTWLIIFRGIQALGGAGLFALALIIIADLYPPRERGKIGGLFGAVFGLSSVLGPLVGGFLTDNASAWIPGIAGWRWVFWVNVPLGIIALLFIVRTMPRLHPGDRSHRFEPLTAVLMILAFFPLVFALQLDKTAYPWNGPVILGLLAASAVFLVLWILASLRSDHPIMNLRLFGDTVLWTGNLGSFFFGAAFMGLIIFLPLYMVAVQDVSATNAGLSVIPLSLGIVLGASASGIISTRTGRYKMLMLAGAVVTVAAFFLMTTLGRDAPYWQVVVYMILAGIGLGPAQSLYSVAVQNVLPPDQMGQGTSANQFSRQIGSVIGAALMGAVLSASLTAGFQTHMPSDTGMSSGMGAGDRLSSRSPSETKALMEASFDAVSARVEKLFAARGDEARTELDAFLADGTIPAAYRDRLAGGTPAMGIEAAFAAFGQGLDKAMESGDGPALESLLAGPAGKAVPDFAAAALRKTMALPGPARTAAWKGMRPGIFEGLARGLAAAEDAASTAALVPVQAALKEARNTVPARVVDAMRTTFAQAVHDVWLWGLGAAVLLFLATLLIPDRPLRGRGETLEGTGPAVHG